MVDKVYSFETKCKNCKRVNWINQIPTGKEVNEYLDEESIRCRVCNCLLFVPKPSKETKKDKEVLEDD